MTDEDDDATSSFYADYFIDYSKRWFCFFELFKPTGAIKSGILYH